PAVDEQWRGDPRHGDRGAGPGHPAGLSRRAGAGRRAAGAGAGRFRHPALADRGGLAAGFTHAGQAAPLCRSPGGGIAPPGMACRPGGSHIHPVRHNPKGRLVKKIGFLSFGHWSDEPASQARSAQDTLLQSIELAVAAEELGADGAYFRVHHYARQLASPFPLLAAVGARTSRIEIGTAVIDMRYENPLYMAEDAGAADLIAGGRLQLGISRGSPEQVIEGWRYFGYVPAEGESDADMARRHAEVFLNVIEGRGFAQPNPRPMFPNPPGLLRSEPHSPGLRDRTCTAAPSNDTARWAAQMGMHLQSSTLKTDESGKPFHVQQAEQIRTYREAWAAAGHERKPRASVSRSIFPLLDDRDRMYFGRGGKEADQ